jgi:hypothetical protein
LKAFANIGNERFLSNQKCTTCKKFIAQHRDDKSALVSDGLCQITYDELFDVGINCNSLACGYYFDGVNCIACSKGVDKHRRKSSEAACAVSTVKDDSKDSKVRRRESGAMDKEGEKKRARTDDEKQPKLLSIVQLTTYSRNYLYPYIITPRGPKGSLSKAEVVMNLAEKLDPKFKYPGSDATRKTYTKLLEQMFFKTVVDIDENPSGFASVQLNMFDAMKYQLKKMPANTTQIADLRRELKFCENRTTLDASLLGYIVSSGKDADAKARIQGRILNLQWSTDDIKNVVKEALEKNTISTTSKCSEGVFGFHNLRPSGFLFGLTSGEGYNEKYDFERFSWDQTRKCEVCDEPTAYGSLGISRCPSQKHCTNKSKKYAGMDPFYCSRHLLNHVESDSGVSAVFTEDDACGMCGNSSNKLSFCVKHITCSENLSTIEVPILEKPPAYCETCLPDHIEKPGDSNGDLSRGSDSSSSSSSGGSSSSSDEEENDLEQGGSDDRGHRVSEKRPSTTDNTVVGGVSGDNNEVLRNGSFDVFITPEDGVNHLPTFFASNQKANRDMYNADGEPVGLSSGKVEQQLPSDSDALRTELSKLTVAALKEKLKDKGLKASGNKAHLIQQLLNVSAEA